MRKFGRLLTMRITFTAFVLLLQTLQCLASDDSPFQLTNKATGFCLVKFNTYCFDIRWTTGDRLLVNWKNKCLGAQGKSVGSEITLHDCDETNELQKWECKNQTVLALKGQELYIELTADNTAVLSKSIGPNNHLTISGTSSGACSRTYREFFTIAGNAFGKPCMFPFLYKNHWYSDCTKFDSSDNRFWCAVETKYEQELWGYCPTNSKENWNNDITRGVNYQLNTQSSLTWYQAAASCKQQSSSLLSITDPHEQAYIRAILGAGDGGQGYKLWTGLTLDTEHGWQWSNGRPYRYLNWDSGHPLSDPGHTCGVIDGAVQYSWQSTKCNKNLGYICYSKSVSASPTEATEAGFCSAPWIPYNGHCFHLDRAQKTWSDAMLACRKEGGDLVSIRNLEDQSFVISQLGYASTDELWIGLNDRKTERLFDWSDHSTVSFTNWEYGKPAVATEGEDCVLIRGENGNWADRACTEKHGFICMKMSASQPSGDEVEQNIGCKTGWKRHGSYCYFVGTQTKTFDEAKDDCKSSDSYLADVSTGVDNAFLVSLVGLRPEKHFWLGLSNQRNIDVFVWTNTNSVKFTHWNAQMPGHQQGCVAMATGSLAGLWDVLPCTNKEKYICKHLAEGAVLTPVPPTVPSSNCADGWTTLFSRNICYKLYQRNSQKKTWYEARDYCRAIGGDLLSIHSNDEIQMIQAGYGIVWIGLSAPNPVTGYVWSDGSPVNFQHWEDEEPNNANGVESCAEFKVYWRSQAGSWNDVHCEKYNSWICQIGRGVTPKPPPDPVAPEYNRTSDGWLIWKGNQYYINNRRMAMEEARRFCQQRHGDLVTINSEAESIFLWKQISRTSRTCWIGLTVELDGSFQWMDGSQVVFQRWDDGQPNFGNFDENCAVMTPYTGFWHDYNCGFEHNSICKRSDSLPANTTVAPTVPPQGGCPVPWKKFQSKCYNIINNQNLTWQGARTKCQQMGGNLASISSRHVQVFLMSQMADEPTTDLWIGFHNIHNGQFLWTDGRPVSYNNLGVQSEHHHMPYYFHGEDHWMISHHDHMRHNLYLYQPDRNCAVINTSPSLGIGKWIIKSCNDTNGFVCLQNLVPSLPDSPQPTTPTNYIKILNDSVKVVPQQMTWDAAKKNCEGDGANLASLRNDWIQTYVELLALNLKAPLWIGLNKKQTNGNFRFVDGWHITLAHWGPYEPRTNQDCVYMDVDGKWKTAVCNQTMNSVCMKSTDVPPAEPTGFPGVCPEDPDVTNTYQKIFWKPFRGYCYKFFTETKKWTDAAASCGRHGGMLASIEDASEQEFIQRNINILQDSSTSFWMGLFKTHKGEWRWLDRTVMDYTNWEEGQSSNLPYGEISTSDGTWKTSREWYRKPYICKTSKVLLPTPSPSAEVELSVRHRGHITLAVVLVIVGIAVGVVIAFFINKKHGHRITIPDSLTTFDNPLFFNSRKPQPDLVDTNKLIENAEEENTELVVTM